jgi:hypothetical protein
MAGLIVKNPQPLGQTYQSTPASIVSFATAAIRLTVALAATCDGSEGTNAMEGVVFGLIAMEPELALDCGLATEVATIVTKVPVVVTGGAV